MCPRPPSVWYGLDYHPPGVGPLNSCRFPPVLFTPRIVPWQASIESAPATLRAGTFFGQWT